MKKFLSIFLAFLMLQSAFSFAALPVNAFARVQETMTNQMVVEMVKAGFSDEVVVAKIRGSRGSFDTNAAALQQLKKSGVSDAIILAMVQKSSGTEVPVNNQMTGGNGGGMSVSVPDGTEIKIVTIEDISGQKVVEGDPLTFKVSEDVVVNGKTVIAKGAIVKGTVSSAKKKGFMGKGGDLSVRIESTETVDGQKLKLRAAKSGKGGDNVGSTVALTVLFGPLGLLRKGKEAKIKAGTVLSAFTDENKTVMAN
jgi:hypothetical protein